MNLMKYKTWYFVFSMLIILPGLYFLVTSGLKAGIDFTGGALLEYRFEKSINSSDLKTQISSQGIEVGQITPSSDNVYIIRTKPIEQVKINTLKSALNEKFGAVEERRVEFVGPVIGNELRQKAFIATALASIVIVLYLAFSFRKVPRPMSSWRFGIAAVIALIHDILVVVGAFAILGKFLNVEIDTLFVTALLTVIGFSVHDTIVVFDRIRENLTKMTSKKFIDVANLSVIQTLGRSLNTSLTVVFVLLAMLLFGGETIRWFVVALLIGIISGTYSSIFNATALLVWWEERLGH
ncbi:protein-export membrane protein SecF [Candidatus Daviesbacteria bacterium RIFCSPHIGHO2_01_FULL_40_24]|nr:MAG: protein-export membrane protein SecF [Candidatus Daviesbacteria bacterium RIFCSPHIGHO2_01_FULL_40_24]OGE28287.1 MAG: protein-export membrane protein SecF [Candidatus Daviesbacteria bacterium RIFCSPHIGHO2_02_FULL_40_16]OGE41907.1 MAG: protein-export membrane protein SecF [Candidatus Daviesbacteria bacterium RIFCSPLOWO2_01_FULL_39_23]OGE66705.1 MAG: protein-export membrane protein SecF [Candidatus Daviesbacteria bacterium RIFCSPLOWO2_02_FULL_39_13]HCE30534.1 protein translocase subunit Se